MLKLPALFKKITSAGRRNKTARQHAGWTRQLMQRTGHSVHVKAEAKAGTANWRFDGGHRIVIQDYTDPSIDLLQPAARFRDDALIGFGKSLLRHEAAHGHFSDRDLKKVTAELKRRNLPFWGLNLFEDARIEHMDRQRVASAHSCTPSQARFGWTKWASWKAETDRASSYILALIRKEASLAKAVSNVAPKWTGSRLTAVGDPAPRVLNQLYRNAIDSQSTMAVIEVVEAFFRHFPEEKKSQDGETPGISDSIGGEDDATYGAGTNGGTGGTAPEGPTNYSGYKGPNGRVKESKHRAGEKKPDFFTV